MLRRIAALASASSLIAGSALADVPYLIGLDVTNQAGILEKLLLVDLLDIFDPEDIGGELEGVSEPEQFSFPFNSIESVVPLGESSLGVAIKQQLPGRCGPSRRHPGRHRAHPHRL